MVAIVSFHRRQRIIHCTLTSENTPVAVANTSTAVHVRIVADTNRTSKETVQSFSSPTTVSPHHQRTASLQRHGDPRHHKAPGDSAKHQKLSPTTDDTMAVKSATLPHSSTDSSSATQHVPDPASLYDVPTSALSNGPMSTYDVPKSALIATGHYKTPPPTLGEGTLPLEDGVYDVPPSTSAIYDVPPDANRQPQQGANLYDVPPLQGTRPRLNSEPTLQLQLAEACRSVVVGSAGSDNPFMVEPDYSHYDVPKHLLKAYTEESQQQQAQSERCLSRWNSSPSHAKNMMTYDVPHTTLLTQGNIGPPMAPKPDGPLAQGNNRPPTAPKPSRTKGQGSTRSRSHSVSSPLQIASPEHKPHPNAVFPPLDPEFLAQRLQENEASSSNGRLKKRHQHPTHASSHGRSKKRKVPPPTKRRPERMADGVRTE